MPYIHSFTINGLAGHRRPVSYELDRFINVFWGLNGTGKTSMLKILHAALNNDASDLAAVPFHSALVVFWSETHHAYFRRRYEKSEHGEIIVDDDGDAWERVDDSWQMIVTSPAWQTDLVSLAEGGRLVEVDEVGRKTPTDRPFRHSYLPISRMSDVDVINRRTPAGQRSRVVDDSFLDEQFARHVHYRWQDYNSTALGEIRSIQQQGLAQILAILFGRVEKVDRSGPNEPIVVKEVDGHDAYNLVLNFLRQQGITLSVGRSEFISSYESNNRLQSVISSIETTTEKVNQALRPQQEFSEAIGRLYSGGKHLDLEASASGPGGLRVRIGEEFIPIKSLSSGEKQLLRIMLEVLAADTNTVMIDEPELSMHPDWQLVLVDTMRRINPRCQIILATHSPEVMADVESERVFQL